MNEHPSICYLIQVWICLKKLYFHEKWQNHFTRKSVSTFIIYRNLSERKIEFILPYLVRNFQINARCKLTAKSLLTFSHYTRSYFEYSGYVYMKNKLHCHIYIYTHIYIYIYLYTCTSLQFYVSVCFIRLKKIWIIFL